jgi:hypothetical protein
MPCLEGIPCSIHGIVFPDHVVALRPVEMVVHRRPVAPRFRYAGCATWWDPPTEDRDEMRAIARRVGAQLRDEVDFRGAFTVDGVLSADGFLPTELNPRMGAGLNTMMTSISELPLQLVLDALVGEIALDLRPVELEATILAAADATRSGGTWTTVDAVDADAIGDDGRRVALGTSGDDAGGDAGNGHATPTVRWAEPGERGAGTVVATSSPQRSFVRCLFDADALAAGPSIAPVAAAFWAFTDRELGTGVGLLEPARAVR